MLLHKSEGWRLKTSPTHAFCFHSEPLRKNNKSFMYTQIYPNVDLIVGWLLGWVSAVCFGVEGMLFLLG